MEPVPQVVQKEVLQGWDFADLKDPTKEKKVMDPVTMLVILALFPRFEESTKIGLSGRKVTIQEPSTYKFNLYFTKVNLRGVVRKFYREDNNNLEVFNLCTINAAEYFDPVNNPEIRKLFEYARDGIESTKKAYENGQSSARDAIGRYQETLQKALDGRIEFKNCLSMAEEKVKKIWSHDEIVWLNTTIRMILQKKEKTDLDSILTKLQTKEKLFEEICQEVMDGKLSIEKRPKPRGEAETF